MTITVTENEEATGMKVIRQATNSDGDYVEFLRLEPNGGVIYAVDLFNSRTGRTLEAYSSAIGIDNIGRKHLERAAQETALAVFKEACDFMGISLPEDGK